MRRARSRRVKSAMIERRKDRTSRLVTFTTSSLLRLAVVAAVAIGVTSLAGCGRKGDPEVPTVGKAEAVRPVGIPVGPTTESKPATKPKRSFVLDPLL